MGEIQASVTLENTTDHGLVSRGLDVEANVRRTTIDAIVDTGAVELVLPEEVVDALGLERVGTRTVVYADERRGQRPVAGPVTVEIGDLAMRTECIVGVAGSEALLGQTVLEVLDLVADCRNRTLTPRHPDGPVLALRRQGGHGTSLDRGQGHDGPLGRHCSHAVARGPRGGLATETAGS